MVVFWQVLAFLNGLGLRLSDTDFCFSARCLAILGLSTLGLPICDDLMYINISLLSCLAKTPKNTKKYTKTPKNTQNTQIQDVLAELLFGLWDLEQTLGARRPRRGPRPGSRFGRSNIRRGFCAGLGENVGFFDGFLSGLMILIGSF